MVGFIRRGGPCVRPRSGAGEDFFADIAGTLDIFGEELFEVGSTPTDTKLFGAFEDCLGCDAFAQAKEREAKNTGTLANATVHVKWFGDRFEETTNFIDKVVVEFVECDGDVDIIHAERFDLFTFILWAEDLVTFTLDRQVDDC